MSVVVCRFIFLSMAASSHCLYSNNNAAAVCWTLGTWPDACPNVLVLESSVCGSMRFEVIMVNGDVSFCVWVQAGFHSHMLPHIDSLSRGKTHIQFLSWLLVFATFAVSYLFWRKCYDKGASFEIWLIGRILNQWLPVFLVRYSPKL